MMDAILNADTFDDKASSKLHLYHFSKSVLEGVIYQKLFFLALSGISYSLRPKIIILILY